MTAMIAGLNAPLCSFARALAATLLLLTIAAPLRAETIHENSTGITVTVEENGHYSIQTNDPLWVFTGTLPATPSALKTVAGHDGIGDYGEITFTFGTREGSIRTYPGRAAVLFTDRYTAAAANGPGFPKLSVSPDVPGRLSFRGKWSQFQFDLSGTEGPWVYFDDAGHSFLLSPASDFMVANLNLTNDKEIESRISPRIKDIPRGLAHRTLLVVANGINRAFDTWGHALTDLNGKVRPANDSDPSLKSLGYWTDNGASYYYDYEDSLGYTGTLLAVKDEFAKAGVALGYMQIDSWWYPKGEDGHWNLRTTRQESPVTKRIPTSSPRVSAVSRKTSACRSSRTRAGSTRRVRTASSTRCRTTSSSILSIG